MQGHDREVSPTLDKPIGDPAICRGQNCGQTIFWRVLPSGKRCPFNADGSLHFATCVDRRQFQRRKAK